jgi:hypothetical protein
MRKWTLYFLIIFSYSTISAQNSELVSGYIPPEFLTPAKVIRYYSDTTESIYYEDIKLRDDCRFIIEYCYTRYGGTVINRYVGNYFITNDTLFFEFNKIRIPPDIMILNSPAVPFEWGDPPEYLVIKKGRMFESKKYTQRNYVNYTLSGKLEFELIESHCR